MQNAVSFKYLNLKRFEYVKEKGRGEGWRRGVCEEYVKDFMGKQERRVLDVFQGIRKS